MLPYTDLQIQIFSRILDKYQWEGIPVSYDFRIFKPVIATRPHDTEDPEKIADYDYLAKHQKA